MLKIQEIGRKVFINRGQITQTTIDKTEVKQAWKAEHSKMG